MASQSSKSRSKSSRSKSGSEQRRLVEQGEQSKQVVQQVE